MATPTGIDADVAFLAEGPVGEPVPGSAPTPTVTIPGQEGGKDTPPKPPEGTADTPPTPPAEPKPGEEPPEKKEGEEPETPEPPAAEEPEPEEFEATASRPSLKAFREEFPEALKKHPYLREAYYLEGQYRQVFPAGPEAAKEAAGKAQALDNIEEALMSEEGDTGYLLDQIHENGDKGPDALHRFVHGFLPALRERSADLYREVTEPLAINLIRYVFKEGVSSKDINIQNAARIVAKVLYKSYDIPEAPKPFSGRTDKGSDNPEVQRLRQELQERDTRASRGFHQTYMTDLKKSFVKEFAKGLDPDNVLNEFTRDAITNAAIVEIGELLRADPAHVAKMKGLLAQAAKSGYAAEYVPKLISAYLGGARTHLPGLRRKLLERAIGKQESKSGGNPPPKPPGGKPLPTGGRPPSPAPQTVRDEDIDWSRTTPEQFLADEITLKKKG